MDRDSLGLMSSLIGETGDEGGPGLLLLKPNICCCRRYGLGRR